MKGALSDLSALADQAQGGVSLEAALSGDAAAPEIEATATGNGLTLSGKPFGDATARIAGALAGPGAVTKLSVSGVLGGAPVDLEASLADLGAGSRAIKNLSARIGSTSAEGGAVIRADGLAEGEISLRSDDLSSLGSLLLTPMSGHGEARIVLAAGRGQDATITAKLRNIAYAETRIGTADIDLRGRDLTGAPALAGSIRAESLASGSLLARTIRLEAAERDGGTRFEALADMAQGRLATAGSLLPTQHGLDLAIHSLTLSGGPATAHLAAPTVVSAAGGTVTVPRTMLRIGSGTVTLSGRAGPSALDLTADIAAVPLSIADAIVKELGAQGTVSGRLHATGTAGDPKIEVTLKGKSLSAAAVRKAGAPAIDLDLSATVANQTAAIDATATGPGNLSIRAKGTAPFQGAGFDVSVEGTVPLSLADGLLAAQNARSSGAAQVRMRIDGTVTQPRYAGTVAIDGGAIALASSGVNLKNIVLRSRLDGKRVTIETLTATSGDGTIKLTGTVGTLSGDGFPADLAVAIRSARYEDGKLVAATADGDLTVKGKLTGDAAIHGVIRVARAEITVPDRLPANTLAVDIEHQGADGEVQRTLKSAGLKETRETKPPTGSSPGLRLDVKVAAPARIFIRGRGLDAELGGELTLVGNSSAPRALGGFELRRGRLALLGERVEIERGVVTLDNDFDPTLDFQATTRGESITVTATVTGQASRPQIGFSSVPELPQDEVLAQFLFQKNVAELSPLQLAQLGAAAAELGGVGGGGPGLMGNIRNATGIDDIDVVMDKEGNTGVKAGRYISDKVYLGVKGGAADSSGVTVDLNITDSVKARGETDVSGKSSVGVFFEREY